MELRADRPRDRRAAPVGADGERRRGTEGHAASARDALDSAHCAAACQQAGYQSRAEDLGSGRAGRIQQQSVEHRSARGAQRGYSVAGADFDRLIVVAVAEPGRMNGRGTRGDDRIEQTPAVQLQDAATHERMRGQRVGAPLGGLDHEHPQTPACKQHRGSGARAPSADDDHVVVAIHGLLLKPMRRNERGGRRRPRRHRRRRR